MFASSRHWRNTASVRVDIAGELDVDPKTLQRHFGKIIATAVAQRKAAETMPCGNVRKQEALERRSRCGIEWYAQTGRNEISAGLSGQKRRMNKRELTGPSEAVGQIPQVVELPR